ncbi:MAG: hypothetical protein ACO31W_03245, partial [Gemmatimonadaceae bacterium]
RRAARREIDALLERAGCAGLFRPILGADDLTQGLPAAWTRVMAQMQTRFPGQRLQPSVVSDALETIREGRRAGLGTILIGAIPAHEAIEADAWLESLADLTPDRVRALRASPSGDPL